MACTLYYHRMVEGLASYVSCAEENLPGPLGTSIEADHRISLAAEATPDRHSLEVVHP